MSRLQELQQARADLVIEGDAIFETLDSENRNMTAEEKERDDAREVELVAVNDNLLRAERHAERVREMAVVPDPNEDTAAEVAAREGQFPTFGEQLQAIHRAAVEPHSIDPRLTISAAVSGMSEGVPPPPRGSMSRRRGKKPKRRSSTYTDDNWMREPSCTKVII